MSDERPGDGEKLEDSAGQHKGHDGERGSIPEPRPESRDNASDVADEKRAQEMSTPSAPGAQSETQTFDLHDRRVHDRPVRDSDAGSFDEHEIEYKTLGKYRIVKRLGNGGMGVVYKAYDDALRRWVAIKTLSRTLSGNVVARRRFIREARAAAAVRHPNVVTIHAVEEQDDTPFIVMEYIDGCTLRDLRRGGEVLTPMHILRISVQVAAGLAAAHVQGVIHRDIKPGNIMIEGEDRVVLTDFGLARAAVDNVELTSGAMPLGTPAYMSPEQVKGSAIDARSDLFSFGCVLYAMFTGHSPFQGQNALEIARNVTERVPRPLVDVEPRTPPFLSEIVERLLEKNPAKRYQSSLEVLDVLNANLAQLNQTATNELSTVLYRKSKPPRRAAHWLAVASGAILAMLFGGLLMLKPWKLDPAGDAPVIGGAATAPAVPRVLSVGKQGAAEFASIQRAIDAASPGCTIRVIDDATYAERIRLAGVRDLLIEAVSDPPATLVSLDADSGIISLQDVESIAIRGFSLSADNNHAILLQGDCSLVTLDRLRLRQSKAGNATALLQVNGDAVANSLSISNCRFFVEGHGQAIWISQGDLPIDGLRIEHNRFQAEFTHVAIMRPLRASRLSHNLFANGQNGINLSLSETSPDELPEDCLHITNNTMVGVVYWLGMLGTIPARADYASIANNLLVNCGRLQGPPEEIAKAVSAWRCEANYWQHPPIRPEDQERVENLDLRITAELDSIELISLDPNDPRFGEPVPGDRLFEAGVGGVFPAYVGAYGPPSTSTPSP